MNALFVKWILNDNCCTIIYVIAIVYMSAFCCWDDVYCVIYKAYKVYNNKATKYAKCTTTKHKKCIMYCRNAYVSYFNSLVFNRVYRITVYICIECALYYYVM